MTFTLSSRQLVDIARRMQRDLRVGLEREGTDLLCIPTYLPAHRRYQPGKSLALDLGGTNVRCAVVSLSENGQFGIDQGPITEAIPIPRNKAMEREPFLDFLTRLIRRLDPTRGLPLGFCFSYPARPTPDGDAVILDWTKELLVSDTIGSKAGDLLLSRIRQSDPGLIGDDVFVINDTVAALLAGRASIDADAYIGLIVGTGTNMAVLLPAAAIPKINQTDWPEALLPVNLESGNFHPPHLTGLDDALDASSRNPSRHRFEKAVSGVYLPYLFKQACPGSSLEPERGSAPLFDSAYPSRPGLEIDDPPSREALIARQIIERSAALTAAALAGVVAFLAETLATQSVCITAEGGLFYAHPRYRETVTATLKSLQRQMALSDISVDLHSIADANLLGCALAALSTPLKHPQPT